jgi:hypothetical protein
MTEFLEINNEVWFNNILNSNNKPSWFVLSSHSNITPDIISKYPHLEWNWRGMSFNPNLFDWSIVDSHYSV